MVKINPAYVYKSVSLALIAASLQKGGVGGDGGGVV